MPIILLSENTEQDRDTAFIPIGVSGVRRGSITSWEELARVEGDVAVTDLRSLLAHEPLVVVVSGPRVLGVITQEMYLGGLWGTVR